MQSTNGDTRRDQNDSRQGGPDGDTTVGEGSGAGSDQTNNAAEEQMASRPENDPENKSTPATEAPGPSSDTGAPDRGTPDRGIAADSGDAPNVEAQVSSEAAAERVIATFGGIRPMAAKLGVPATTVQGWKKRGVIPEARRDELVKAAADNALTLDDAVLSAALTVDRPDDSSETARGDDAHKATLEKSGQDKSGGDRSPVKTPTRQAASPWDANAARSGDTTAAPKTGPDTDTSPSSGPGATPSTPTPVPPPAPASGSVPVVRRDAGLLAVAVVALLIAVIAVVGLLTYPAWSPRYLGTPDPAVLANRIDALENDLGAAVEEPRAAVEGFEARIAAMETDMADALARIDAFTGVEIDGRPLADILNDLDGRTETLATQIEAVDDRMMARVPALEDRVTAVEGLEQGRDQAISALDGRIAGLEAERSALGDVRQSLDTLDRRISAIQDDVTGVSGRLQSVAGVAEQAAATDATTMALVLAVGQLRDALFNGAAFSQSLETVRTVAGDDAAMTGAIDTLDPYAGSGAPTLSELQTRFPAMAAAVREAASAPVSGSWTDEALARVQGIVTIRPSAGEVEGDTPDAILARAEIRVMSDNLRGAVEALADLEGPTAEAASEWVRLANDRIAVEDALSILNDTAVRRLLATRDEG